MTRRKRYSAEFKREALRRADEPSVTNVLVAEELRITAVRLQNNLDFEGKVPLRVENGPNGLFSNYFRCSQLNRTPQDLNLGGVLFSVRPGAAH